MTTCVRNAADDRVTTLFEPGGLDIGLINSAPAASFERVTGRFATLLGSAAGGREIRLRVARFGSLPPVAKGVASMSVDRLLGSRPDALIVTGAEPTCEDLTGEPHWAELTALHDWAIDAGVPLVLSCLAAHAAVLHADGIERRRLPDKCFGVFEVDVVGKDPLLRGLPSRWMVPHSRWNGLCEGALRQAGYSVLTRSAEIGVDLFVRRERALNVYLQGHPEYGPTTLLIDYRRDVRRAALTQTRAPLWPVMAGNARWSGAATQIFGNWLGQIDCAGAQPVLAGLGVTV